MSTLPSTPRYYGLDALRTMLMFLGIASHVGAPYMTHCPGFWLIKDIYQNHFFDSLVFIIHSFRMEVFYVISGFFMRYIYQRGLLSFIYNRSLRILLPLAIAWPLMNILMQRLARDIMPPERVNVMQPFHLWFLYYLLLLYVVIIFAKMTFSTTAKQRINRLLSAITHSRLNILIWAALTWPFMLLMPMVVNPPYGFFPFIHLLIYYFLFFICGWEIQKHPHLLQTFAKRRWYYFLCALPIMLTLVVLFIKFGYDMMHYPWRIQMLIHYAYACNAWLISLALLGFATASFNFYHPAVQYVVNASYWFYLIHLPIVIFLQRMFQPFLLPSGLKFTFIVTITLTALFASYHFLIYKTRST